MPQPHIWVHAESEAFVDPSATTHPRGARARAVIILFLYRVANGALDLARKALWPVRPSSPPRHICVYRVGSIGDIVCSLPAIAAIRDAHPDAHITLLTASGGPELPGARMILEQNPLVDEIWPYKSHELAGLAAARTFASAIRLRRFDLWIELPSDIATLITLVRNMLFARLCGVRDGYGWQLNTIRQWTRLQSEWLRFPNEVQRLRYIVGDAGVASSGTTGSGFSLALHADARETAAEIFRVNAMDDGRPVVALAPGAKQPANRWPPDRYAAVGRMLAALGCRIVILGSASEQALCEGIRHGVGGDALSLAGRTSVLATAALIARCSLVIANDSGIQHLSAAVGTPSVSVFAFRHLRGKWWPDGEVTRVLQTWVPCHTCFLDACPNNNACTTGIAVETVYENALPLLAISKPDAKEPVQ